MNVLGDVLLRFETGRNLKAQGRPAAPGELGVLKLSAVSWGEFDPAENKALPRGVRLEARERVQVGDLLISRANTAELVGAVVRVKERADNLMLPDKILRLVIDESRADPDYVMHALRRPEARKYFAEVATGTSDSMRNLSQPKIAGVRIPLPPLHEQRRIVAKLDALRARSRRAKDALLDVRAMAGRVVETFARRAEPRLLRELLVERDEHAGQRWNELPAVGLSNAGTIEARRERIGAKTAHKCQVVHPGDVVFNPIRLSIGSIARYRGTAPAIVSPEYVVATPSGGLSGEYLVHFLRSPLGRSLLENESKGSVRYRVYFETLAQMAIPFGSVEDQAALEAALHLAAIAANRAEDLVRDLAALDAAILGAAFRGELLERCSAPSTVGDEAAQ